MHGTDATPGNGPDGVWNMCQHQSWFFLPWHRMYILWFERIVRDIVTAQGGPADWALPYWNWQTNRALPPAFREPNLPADAGGGLNPLFIANRVRVNDGTPMVPAIVDSTAAEATIPFVGGAAGAFGFGGGVIDAPSHFGAGMTGQLERQPHNNVHRTISGTMGTAASPLDPIFWLHHAQVDRLWGRWLRLGGGRSDPSDVRWLDQRFRVLRRAGSRGTCRTPREVLSTRHSTTVTRTIHRRSRSPAALVSDHADAALARLRTITMPLDNPEELGASGPLELGAGVTSATSTWPRSAGARQGARGARDQSVDRGADRRGHRARRPGHTDVRGVPQHVGRGRRRAAR